MPICEQCKVKSNNALSSLNLDELETFSSNKTYLKFNKGEYFLSEGTSIGGLYCIEKGKAKLTKLNTNGKEQIIKFIKSGDILGHRTILSSELVGLNAIALEEMQVCFIPKRDVLTVIKNNQNFSMDLIKNVSLQLNEANNLISLMAQKPVRERLAELLLQLEEIFMSDKDGYIDVVLTREEIANSIGTATESAIRLISNFKNAEIIDLKGKRIKILDSKKLKNLSNGY